MSTFSLLSLAVIQQIALSDHPFFGHVPIAEDERPSYIRDELLTAENRINIEDLPESLDWRDYNGQNYMPWTRNQHTPTYCGSCWAFSATTAFASRIMISRNNAFPEISLSPQLVLDCDTKSNFGCMGGDALGVYRFFHEDGAVEDSCSPYIAESWYTDNRECGEYSYCSYTATNHQNEQQEYKYSHYPKFYVDEYGSTTNGEKAIMKLLQEGPIVCVMAVDDDFYYNYDGGIYQDTTNYMKIDHEIVMLGYGVDGETGQKYWIAMNSWGTSWGEDGYFRIVRGVNNLAIETYCIWATPESDGDGDALGLNKEMKADALSMSEVDAFEGSLGGGLLAMKSEELIHNTGHQTSPLPQDYMHEIELPQNFGWHDIEGQNYLNLVRQINSPQRCDAVWAFAVTEIVSDRINVMNYLAGNDASLEVNLSPQVLINENAGGDCDGGYAADAMKYLYDTGVPDETCQNYQAKSNPHPDNPEYNICYTCDPDGGCYDVEPNQLYKVQEYGYLNGVSNMKSEIYARGPIACSIYVDDEFQAYKHGIFASTTHCDSCSGYKPDPNYMVSIVGWGYDENTDEEYWIAKNNWGIAWGLDGYIKIKMNVNSNGIEDHCIWGVPQFDDELLILTRRMNEVTANEQTKEDKYSFLSWLVERLPAMSLV